MNARNQRAETVDIESQATATSPLRCIALLYGEIEVAVNDASDRCAAFIADIAEVCKKHRVMMRLDEDEIESPVFEEHPPAGGSGFGFILEAEDLEDAIGNAVWEVIHPSA